MRGYHLGIKRRKRQVFFWIVAGFCYWQCFQMFLEIPRDFIRTVYLWEEYPDDGRAEEILKTEKELESGQDVCFYGEAGRKNARSLTYQTQTKVMVGMICGDAALFDPRIQSFPQEDKKGCVIDQNTSFVLWGSTNAAGGIICLGDEEYQVRKVIPWKRPMVLIHSQGEARYTQAFLRKTQGNGQASEFLIRYGLSGKIIQTVNSSTAAFLFVIWLPAWMYGKLFLLVDNERRHFGRMQKEYWLWTLLCLMILGVVLQELGRYIVIPREWIPPKWSDFSFWSEKKREVMGDAADFFLFPKTVYQIEQILAVGKCGGWSFFSICCAKLGSSGKQCKRGKKNGRESDKCGIL